MTERTPPSRLASLDALRGFDMFWITGGGALLTASAGATDLELLHALAKQTEHVEWDGFRLWDLVFPLFLFLAGVSMPYSFAARAARGESLGRTRVHIVRRGLALVVLGIVYNGLLKFDFENQRYASVLGRIGLAWMFAALIVTSTTIPKQVLWLVGILVAYWLAMLWVPVPGGNAGNLEPGKTLADWFDRTFLPGRLHRGDRDPEGLLSTIPAISTALMGVCAGHWLRRDASGERKAMGLIVGGLGLLAIGALWSLSFPLNKNLWSSSFALWTGGLSSLLLAAFYYVIDVRGWRRWSFFFVVIGTNAIVVYMLGAFVDWRAVVELLLRDGRAHPVMTLVGAIALQWLVLLALYRRRIFLRV